MSDESINEPVVPEYKIIYSELKKQQLEQIVQIVDHSISEHRLEKDSCIDIIKKLKNIPELDNLGTPYLLSAN